MSETIGKSISKIVCGKKLYREMSASKDREEFKGKKIELDERILPDAFYCIDDDYVYFGNQMFMHDQFFAMLDKNTHLLKHLTLGDYVVA